MQRVDIEEQDDGVEQSRFSSATEAYKALMDETILYALSKDYSKSMNLLQALGDGFCEEGYFSWIKAAKLTGALAIGSVSSIFVASASREAAERIQVIFKERIGVDISYAQIVTKLLQSANTGGSAALGTFTALNLIEAYLGRVSDAEKYLKYRDGTCAETSKKIGRKVFDLFCAVASCVPTYFFSQSYGVPLAVCTAAANTSVSWYGVSSLPLLPNRFMPARKIEIAYLKEQIETFLKLPPGYQNAIISEIDDIRLQHGDDNGYKMVYARLLNLAKPVGGNMQTQINDAVQEEHVRSCPQKSFAIALGLYLTASQISFTEATYAGISRLFPDAASVTAISTGVTAAAFSILPNVGMGYMSGIHAAHAISTANTPLAKLYLSKTREVLKYTIDIVGMFAGGTSFIVAMRAADDLVNLASLQGLLKDCLYGLIGIVSYSTGAIINAYYMLRLCDEILIYFAQRCADENIRKLFTFTLEAKRLCQSLSEMTDENYLDVLRWKLSGGTVLSSLLHHIFDDRMTDDDYIKAQHKLNLNTVFLKGKPSQIQYQLVDKFSHETPEWQTKHPGLRRRKCCIFSEANVDKNEKDRDPRVHSLTVQL